VGTNPISCIERNPFRETMTWSSTRIHVPFGSQGRLFTVKWNGAGFIETE
jgi:hypothetical protein